MKFVVGYGGFHIGDSATSRFNLELNFGVRGLTNDEEEFELKRFQGKPNFMYLRADTSIEHELPYNAQLYWQLAGQAASGPLISNEQYSLGGVYSVRGYLDTQVLVDDAIRTRLEIRSPSFAGVVPGEWFSNARVLAFGDMTYGRVQEPLPGQVATVALSSAGVGFRFDTAFGLKSEIDWAYPLGNNGEIRAGESRFHFRVAQEF